MRCDAGVQMNDSAVIPITRTLYVVLGFTYTTSVWQPPRHALVLALHTPKALPLTVSACGSFGHVNGAPRRPAVMVLSEA
jgi:hypothetical protein